MRDIKFRAWDRANGAWYQFERFGDGSAYDGASWFAISGDGKVYSWKVGAGYIENEGLELVQYTGLKDKNGKEIYEGDIVKHDSLTRLYGGGKDYLIKVNDIRCLDDLWPVYNSEPGDVDNEEIEIIGNIYENPERLEER